VGQATTRGAGRREASCGAKESSSRRKGRATQQAKATEEQQNRILQENLCLEGGETGRTRSQLHLHYYSVTAKKSNGQNGHMACGHVIIVLCVLCRWPAEMSWTPGREGMQHGLSLSALKKEMIPMKANSPMKYG